MSFAMKHLLAGTALVSAMAVSAVATAAPISVVAAENFYGEVAEAIGGDRVVVTDVLSSPNVDPHDYEATPSTARAIADANIVIYNGADYDSWVDKLLAASAAPKRKAINVAMLLGRKAGDNPHLWYDPTAMPAVADAVGEALSAIDPDGAEGYASRQKEFIRSLERVNQKIAAVKQRFAGQPVTASELVFGYMAQALGLDMRNEAFQMDIMNETEPSARQIAAIETDLKSGKVKVFFYNSQVADPLTDHLLSLAHGASVPVVAVSETKPANMGYADWMLSEIDATEKALAGPSS